MQVSLRLVATTLAVLATVPVGAHHSYAMFDMDKSVTLDGTVKDVQWTNPHIWVQLVVKDASGKEAEWSIEGNSPNMLVRAGWTRHALNVGDHAVAVVHPLKNGDKGNSGSLASMVANGQKIFGGQNPAPAEGARTTEGAK
jgi:hypothetical protein